MEIIFCGYRDWSLSLYEKLRKKHKNMVLVNSPKKLLMTKGKAFGDAAHIVFHHIRSGAKAPTALMRKQFASAPIWWG